MAYYDEFSIVSVFLINIVFSYSKESIASAIRFPFYLKHTFLKYMIRIKLYLLSLLLINEYMNKSIYSFMGK